METVRFDSRAKLLGLLVAVVVTVTLVFLAGCGGSATKAVEPDFADAAAIEKALNNGDDVTGKTVKFTVNELVPDSAFGYNLQAGEHLNFVSSENPGIKAGESATVKVTKVESMMGSWIIGYEKI